MKFLAVFLCGLAVIGSAVARYVEEPSDVKPLDDTVKTLNNNVEEDSFKPLMISNSPKIRLYQDDNFHGGYQDYTGDAASLPGFNDETSSIRVYGGTWILYSDSNFRGRQYHVVKDDYNSADAWSGSNDNISSLKLVCS